MSHFFVIGLVVGQNSATFTASGNRFDRMKTKNTQVAQAADFFIVVGGAESMASIFNHLNFIFFSDFLNSFHLARLPGEVNRDDHFCAWRYQFFNLCFVQIVSVQTNVTEDRFSLDGQKHIGGGGESIGCGNGFITVAEADRSVGQMQGGRAARDHDRVFGVALPVFGFVVTGFPDCSGCSVIFLFLNYSLVTNHAITYFTL